MKNNIPTFFVSFLITATAAIFFACSDDSSASAPILPDDMSGEISSSSSSGKNETPLSSFVQTEVVYDTLMNKDSVVMPYYKNDSLGFNWDESSSSVISNGGSSSSAKSSSSARSSSSSVAAPVISGDSLIDSRDNATYKLTMVGLTIWMAEDLRFNNSGSMYYDDDESSEIVLYTRTGAKSACPSGWRLPTRGEFEAASAVEDFPWSFGGRMKGESYSFLSNMGFFWMNSSESFEDGDTDNCSGDDSACSMIFVKKSPDYDGGVGETLFQLDDNAKGFSVRCVKN